MEDLLVNANYKGKLEQVIDLGWMHTQVPHSVLHDKPSMLVIKDRGTGTMLLFGTGNFRVMGCKDHLEATLMANKYAAYMETFTDVTLQSCTASFKLGFPVSLEKLHSTYDNIMYEPELFPAMRLSVFNPLCVNVFHTGAVVICGLRAQAADLDAIIQNVINMCSNL